MTVLVNSSCEAKAGSPSKAGPEKLRVAGPVLSRIEPELAVIVEHAGAAPDDLLELDYRVGEAHEHDVAADAFVDAGGQQLRAGEDDGRARLDVLFGDGMRIVFQIGCIELWQNVIAARVGFGCHGV